MKPLCIYCGKPVLVSKQRSNHGNKVDAAGKDTPYAWHNDCNADAHSDARWTRLVEACDGNEDQAKRVLDSIT